MSRLVDLFVGLALLAVVGRVSGQDPNCIARNASQVYDLFRNPNPTFVNPKNNVTGAACYRTQQDYSVILPPASTTVSTQLQGFAVNLITLTNGRVEFFDSGHNSILNASAPFNSSNKALSAGDLYFTLFESDPNSPAGLLLIANLTSYTAPVTTTTTPTPAPTTSYLGPANVNPGVLSLDLAIGFDTAIGAGTGGQPALDAAISYSTAFVNQLSLTTDLTAGLNSPSGSRLFPFTLPLTDSVGTVGVPFQYNSIRFNGFTGTVFNTDPTVPKSYYVQTLNAVLDKFDISKNGPTRPTAQRVVILLSTNTPSEDTSFGSISGKNGTAANDDVHVIVVSFNNKTWPDEIASNMSSPFVQQLVYDYSIPPFNNTIALLNLLTNGDFLCQQPAVNTTNKLIISPNFNFGNSGSPTVAPTNGQSGRYCNFQNSRFNVTAPSKDCTSFAVNYELETDVDFLHFWDANGNRVASFTGLDVNDGNFVVNNSAWVNIEFTTDSKTVLGGFQISYKGC